MNGQASGPVLLSGFLVDLAHSVTEAVDETSLLAGDKGGDKDERKKVGGRQRVAGGRKAREFHVCVWSVCSMYAKKDRYGI